jgi:pseudouridine-5'-phosphate glycosidase
MRVLVRRATKKPAIAVESAVLCSGLPIGRRDELVRRIRAAAGSAGAEACFVGVARGIPTVGLSEDELRRVAAGGVRKATTRELATAVAERADAGTTVAATLCLAERAGVRVVVTGGIGGVHRQRPERAPDVSADLWELAHTPAIVVSSGPKAVLNLAATLERLESLGVPIVGYGTDECPAFWCRGSGIRLPDRADGPAPVVARWQAWRALGRTAALLVFVPPPDGSAVARAESERWVRDALGELRESTLAGADVTPFLLERIAQVSGGRSVEANLALLEHNARVAAEIAVQLEEVPG